MSVFDPAMNSEAEIQKETRPNSQFMQPKNSFLTEDKKRLLYFHC